MDNPFKDNLWDNQTTKDSRDHNESRGLKGRDTLNIALTGVFNLYKLVQPGLDSG